VGSVVREDKAPYDDVEERPSRAALRIGRRWALALVIAVTSARAHIKFAEPFRATDRE